ncbi:MAG: phosphatidylserine decarboxylase family protein [Rubricoccaceae bacterium]|nr:phosphatidylserine decarboxylase family protein [Rubricoccaceae bacterium]
MFAPEGYPLILASAALAVIFSALGVVVGGVGIFFLFVGLFAFGFTLWFFRDPVRVPPADAPTLILAPADGKVIEVVDEEDLLYVKGPARRLSIFLSPLDVHVNRIPADGDVEYERYVPGDYLVAWHPKASEKNERSEIGVKHPSGTPVLFKQIAGAVARRIVYYPRVGDQVQAGERFGIVKFGSRMDVIVPRHILFDVEIGQKTKAGVTVLGAFMPTRHVDEDVEPGYAASA